MLNLTYPGLTNNIIDILFVKLGYLNKEAITNYLIDELIDTIDNITKDDDSLDNFYDDKSILNGDGFSDIISKSVSNIFNEIIKSTYYDNLDTDIEDQLQKILNKYILIICI